MQFPTFAGNSEEHLNLGLDVVKSWPKAESLDTETARFLVAAMIHVHYCQSCTGNITGLQRFVRGEDPVAAMLRVDWSKPNGQIVAEIDRLPPHDQTRIVNAARAFFSGTPSPRSESESATTT